MYLRNIKRASEHDLSFKASVHEILGLQLLQIIVSENSVGNQRLWNLRVVVKCGIERLYLSLRGLGGLELSMKGGVIVQDHTLGLFQGR